MKRFDKKITVLLGIILCFIIGGTLSFESLARFTKKFDTVNKKVSAATFEVSADSEFESKAEIKPGDVLSSDTIKLKNDNDYPVEFTISLTEKSETSDKEKSTSGRAKNLIDYLTLTIDGVNQTESENHYKTIVNPNDEKVVSAKIEWITGDDIEIYENDILDNIVSYTYDIKAKQLTNKDSGSDDNIGGGNSDGGEESGGTTPDNGNDSSESENINTRILYKSNYSDFNDSLDETIIDGWISISDGNQNLIYVDRGSLILGTKSYTDLNISDFNLNNEELDFEINAQLIENEEIQYSGDGVNLGVNIRIDPNEKTPYEFTCKLYKVKGEDKVYVKNIDGNNSSSGVISDIQISNDGVIEKNNFKLKGKIYLEAGNIKCNIKVSDAVESDGIVIEKTMTGRKYEEGSKLYFNIGNIVGNNGIKINSMEVKAVSKE